MLIGGYVCLFSASAAALGAFVFFATLWAVGWAFLWYHYTKKSIMPIDKAQKLNGMPDGNNLLKMKLLSVRASIMVFSPNARTNVMASLVDKLTSI